MMYQDQLNAEAAGSRQPYSWSRWNGSATNGSSAEPLASARALVRSRPSCRACGAAYFERIASSRASTTTHAVTKARSCHQESRTPRTRAPIANMTIRKRNAMNALTSSFLRRAYLGPLAFVVRWIWRGIAQFARCSTQRLNSSKDMIAVAADIDSSRRLLLSGSPKHATSAVTNTSRDSRP
jgi:hypothetical protein